MRWLKRQRWMCRDSAVSISWGYQEAPAQGCRRTSVPEATRTELGAIPSAPLPWVWQQDALHRSQISRQQIEPGRLTVGSSSEEQEEQQQQEGPLQPRVTPGARRRKRSPYDSTHLCPPQHPSGWGPEGKQSPAGLRHKTPTPRMPGSAGQPLSGVRRVFPNASPIPAPHHHAHLERGMPPERGPAPVRRCQAAASPENSHPTNRTAGRETEPQAGARQRCPLRPQGCSRSGDKTPPPHEGTARPACGERRYSREEGCCWKPPRRPSTHPGR